MEGELGGEVALAAFADDPDAAIKAAAAQCDACRAAASTARPLLRCSKCKVLWYCSKECQVPSRPLPRW